MAVVLLFDLLDDDSSSEERMRIRRSEIDDMVIKRFKLIIKDRKVISMKPFRDTSGDLIGVYAITDTGIIPFKCCRYSIPALAKEYGLYNRKVHESVYGCRCVLI